MKAIVIYNSQTGFTKSYAEWISEELSCECVSFKEKNKVNLSDYDTVIFGSWCRAGGVVKKEWILNVRKENPQKKYIAFVVGASPMSSPNIPITLEKNFPYDCQIQTFYLQGGINYAKMGIGSKMIMKMLCSMMGKKADRTQEEDEMLKMISKSNDISDRKYIAELVEAFYSTR